MKRILKSSFAGSIILALFLLGCNQAKKPESHQPMSHDAVHDNVAHLVGATDETVVANVRTVRAQSGSRFDDVSAAGVINYDEDNLRALSSRVSGRIERLYVRYNFQAVAKGQKIMEIYSPDLANAQQELLFLHRNNEPERAALAKKKLLLLGATQQQVNQLLRTGKIDYSVTVYSPYSGYITENLSPLQTGGDPGGTSVISSSSVSSGSGGGMSSMNGMGVEESGGPAMPTVPQTTPLRLREGDYVSQGQSLFKLVNADKVRAEFYIQPDQTEVFKRGKKVSVTSPGSEEKSEEASVSMVQPYYSSGVNYPLVRVVLPNADKRWRVGELVRLSLKEVKKTGNWLPASAVLQLGNRSAVFVKREGVFKPVEVKVYANAGDWLDVGSSIGEEEVALNAAFLVDSESFIQVENRLEK